MKWFLTLLGKNECWYRTYNVFGSNSATPFITATDMLRMSRRTCLNFSILLRIVCIAIILRTVVADIIVCKVAVTTKNITTTLIVLPIHSQPKWAAARLYMIKDENIMERLYTFVHFLRIKISWFNYYTKYLPNAPT